MKKVFVVTLLFNLILSTLILSAHAQETYYYLHDDSNPEYNEYKMMDYSPPTSSISSFINLDEGPAIWATLPFPQETKINGDVKVTVFIEASFIQPEILPFQIRVIKVSLIDIAQSGNIDTIASTRPTTILFIGNETQTSQTFSMNNVEYILPEGHSLGIKVEKTLDLFSYFPFSILSPFFATNLLYDSAYTKSYALIPFNATGGISLQCFDNEKGVKPGENTTYTLIIYNNGDLADLVQLSSNYAGNKWGVELENEEVIVPAKSFNYTDVVVKAPEDASEGDYINITITAHGSTGSDSVWLNTTVIPLEYSVKVTAKNESVKAEPGKTAKFVFTVENTGDLFDTYNLFVTCVWPAAVERDSLSLNAGNKEDIEVEVTVPENATNGTTQLVALTAKSTNSDEESTAKSTLEVYYYVTPEKEISGSTIGLILFIMGVAVLLIIAYYLGRTAEKTVLLECDERMRELPPGKIAEFVIKVRNLAVGKDKSMKYKFRVEGKIPENWLTEIDKEEILLKDEEEGEITLKVKIPENAPPDEWASIDFIAIPQKGKSEKLNFLITLREPREILEIETSHEPKEFEEGKRVVTKVKVRNVGEKTAEDKKIIIMVNGKEKNRVGGINIPPSSTAEVEIPWIAERENEVEVKVE
ncbi:MAG TPA: hypothetical protein ENI52_00745 [Thermoplasmata archaeon]|nr:hypothetical protein [Thermoplasmata archaeon]